MKKSGKALLVLAAVLLMIAAVYGCNEGGDDDDDDDDNDDTGDDDDDDDNTAEWQIQTIDSGGSAGTYTSIALDSDDRAHISHHARSSEEVLRYTTNASGSWVSQDVGEQGSGGGGWDYTSIALDSNDSAHIGYGSWLGPHQRSKLYYATNAPQTERASWDVQFVDGDDVNGGVGCVVDSSDNAHLGYVYCLWGYPSCGEWQIRYATNASDSWPYQVVDTGRSPVGNNLSVALDSQDKAHITYAVYDYPEIHLMYATNATGSWSSQTVDSQDRVGQDSSVALDSNDGVHIAYYDCGEWVQDECTLQDLKYAANAQGSWQTATIDSDGDVGTYPSIVIDSDDRVHIGYYDATNADLKYATNSSGDWECIAVDSEGNVGRYASIAIDSGDFIHIAYYDLDHNALKYATNR